MVDIKLRSITAPDVTLDTVLPTLVKNNAHTVNVFESVVVKEQVGVPLGAVQFTSGSAAHRLAFTGPTGNFTFASWVKLNTDRNFYNLWLSLAGASSSFFQSGFKIDGTTPLLNDFATEVALAASQSVGQWFFFAVTENTGTGAYTGYFGVEGGSLSKSSGTFTALAQPLTHALLGSDDTTEYLDGMMAQTRYWNAILTDAEVLAEFYSGDQVKTANVGGWWKFEQASTKTTDSSGAANTLTNPGGAGSWATAVGPTISPAPAATPTENVVVSETIDVVYGQGNYASGTAYSGSVSETVTVSESLAAQEAAIVGVSETDSLSESLGVVDAAIVGVSESASVSESTSATYSAVVPTSETVTASESLASQSDEASAVSETVSVSESTAAAFAANVGTSETVSASEGLSAVGAATVDVSETVSASESGSTTYSAVVSPSETVTITENLALGGGTDYSEALSETVTVSESVAAIYATSVSASEQLQLWKGPMPELASTDLHLVAEDWSPGNDWTSRAGGFTAQLVGTLTKSPLGVIERNEINGFGSSAYFKLPANSAHEITNSSQLTWEFLVRTTTSGGILMGRYASPYAGGFDLSLFTQLLAGVYSDDGLSFQRLHQGAINFGNDYHVLTFVLDSTNDTLTTYYNGILDASTSGHTGSIGNTSSVDFFIGNSNGNDQAWSGGIVEVLRHREALSAATIAERFTMRRTAALMATSGAASETVSASESSATAFGATPSVAESLSISDATTLAQVLAQGLPETLTLSESAGATAAFARALAETVTLAESLASASALLLGLAESLSVTESVALAQVLANVLAEAIALSDAILAYIPRALLIELAAEQAVKTGVVSVARKIDTEVSESAQAKTAVASLAQVIATETAEPTAVKDADTSMLGMP